MKIDSILYCTAVVVQRVHISYSQLPRKGGKWQRGFSLIKLKQFKRVFRKEEKKNERISILIKYSPAKREREREKAVHFGCNEKRT